MNFVIGIYCTPGEKLNSKHFKSTLMEFEISTPTALQVYRVLEFMRQDMTASLESDTAQAPTGKSTVHRLSPIIKL